MGLTMADRFWSKVDVRGAEECWQWKACTRGIPAYGCFSIKHKPYRAHRIAYGLTHGEIPEGLCVCHKCDNPLCINPSHLFLGTISENSRDMYSKDRGSHNPPRGQTNARSKLTEADVLQIRELRASGLSYREIGRRLGRAKSTIEAVIYGITWAHVKESKQ